jgi:hypothetical protein
MTFYDPTKDKTLPNAKFKTRKPQADPLYNYSQYLHSSSFMFEILALAELPMDEQTKVPAIQHLQGGKKSASEIEGIHIFIELMHN